MNTNRKSLTSLFVTVLLLGGGFAVIASIDEGYCETHTWDEQSLYPIPRNIEINEGDNFSITLRPYINNYDGIDWESWFAVDNVSELPSFITVTGNSITQPKTLKVTGTNCAPGQYYIEIGECNLDPFYAPWNPFGIKNVKLTVLPNLLDMPYTPPSGNAVANKNWTYSPTPIPDATITVTGASWLSVIGGTIYGVPPAAGDYVITVKMSKANYEDRTETFTLRVVSELVVLNSPSTGVIFAV